MGNSHCVPQAPRRLRASFSRKPSLKGNREDGARKPAGLFGTEAGPDGDTAADKIFHYVPGTVSPGTRGQAGARRGSRPSPALGSSSAESLGRERNRALIPPRGCLLSAHHCLIGQQLLCHPGLHDRNGICDFAKDTVLYSLDLTNLLGLESQPEDLEQPFLSVFKAGRRRAPVRNLGKVIHYAKVQLRFQHSQDISDCYLELFPSYLYFQAHGSEGLTFQGLLPLTELSVCPLEGSRERAFQISGPLPTPLLVLCPSQAELGHWLYHLEKQIALVGGRPRCPRATPQGPPEDELPWVLQRRLTQPWTASGCQVVGSAICASRVKLQHLPSQEQWDRLLVLYPTSLAIFSEEADGLCFKGELPLSAIRINLEEREKQIRSFLIEGRLINTIRVVCASYEDYGRWLLCLQTVCHRVGAALPPGPESFPGLRAPTQVVGGGQGSLSSDGRTSWDSGCPAPASTRTSHCLPESAVPSPADCPAQPSPEQASPDGTGGSGHGAKPRQGGSSRSPRRRARGEGPSAVSPLRLDLTEPSPEDGHPLGSPHSPLYADPYTPPATSRHRITGVQGLDKFLSAVQSSLGPEPSGPSPSGPVSLPISDLSSGLSGPHLLSAKGALRSRASPQHPGSSKGRGPRPPDSPQHVSPTRKVSPDPLPPPPDGHPRGSYDSVRDKALSPSHRWWPRGAPETEEGLVQWI